jgi:uncharacterized membrane protein HdeD (DUF308 family)
MYASDATPHAIPIIDLSVLQRRWWLFLAVGTLFIVGGALAIIWPAAASVAIALFIGWLLIASGIVQAIAVIADRGDDGLVWRAIWAILSLVAGLYLVARPLDGTITLTVVLAAYFIASGIIQIALGLMRDQGMPRWLMIVGGVLGLVVGLLIAVDLPSSADWAIGLLTGVWLLWEGARTLVLAFILRQLAHDLA